MKEIWVNCAGGCSNLLSSPGIVPKGRSAHNGEVVFIWRPENIRHGIQLFAVSIGLSVHAWEGKFPWEGGESWVTF